MDKKIILSVLIVALIGIVAATYQINVNEDLFNPLASIETDESPVTDALAAPSSESSNGIEAPTDAQADAQANAQADAQAQQQADAQADAQAQATGTSDSDDANTASESDSSQGTALITSDNPISADTNGSTQSGNSGSGQKSSTVATGGDSDDTPTTPSSSPANPDDDDSDNDPDDDSDNDPDSGSTITASQAATNIIKEAQENNIVLTIDQSSVTTKTIDGEKHYIFEATTQNEDLVHVYYNTVTNYWYIYEDGTGPKDTQDP